MAKVKRNYKAVGCPTCQVPAGHKCIKIEATHKVGSRLWQEAKTVPYHQARKKLYEKTHGKTFEAVVIPTPDMGYSIKDVVTDEDIITQPGNEILSGTDRLNRLMGRRP